MFYGDGDNKTFFTQKIRCRKCGWAFRKITGAETETWACSRKGLTLDVCHSPKLKKVEIENAFIRMYNALQENSKKVLDETINLLQSLKVKCNLGNPAISEIDSELATLATQNKAYADMLASGAIDDVIYAEKSDRTKRKMAELRSRRLKLLNADEEEKCIEGLRKLKRILEREPKAITEFSPKLFDEIVDVIFVEQDGTMAFKVKGDLELKIRR